MNSKALILIKNDIIAAPSKRLLIYLNAQFDPNKLALKIKPLSF